MILVFSIAFLACVCLLLLNFKYISNSSQKVFASKLSFSKAEEEWYLQFIPNVLKQYVEANLIYTKLSKNEVYRDLFYSTITAFLIFVSYCISLKSYLLLLSLMVLMAVILDFALKVRSGKKSFIDSLDHLISCLEILTVKSETPLSSSLKIVSDSLPDDLYVAKKEINNILQKSEKLGMEQSLNDLERESIEEQEFVSILLAIQKGTNKNALKKNLSDFLNRQKSLKEEKRKLFVENMQLYLMLPGTVMLIIAMYPLIDMISFQLQGAL